MTKTMKVSGATWEGEAGPHDAPPVALSTGAVKSIRRNGIISARALIAKGRGKGKKERSSSPKGSFLILIRGVERLDQSQQLVFDFNRTFRASTIRSFKSRQISSRTGKETTRRWLGTSFLQKKTSVSGSFSTK